MKDGYYLLHGEPSGKPVPVEVYTIKTSPEPRQFVRGLHVACTVRRALELDYTFEPLARITVSRGSYADAVEEGRIDENFNIVERTVGNLEYFEQDANDLDKVL